MGRPANGADTDSFVAFDLAEFASCAAVNTAEDGNDGALSIGIQCVCLNKAGHRSATADQRSFEREAIDGTAPGPHGACVNSASDDVFADHDGSQGNILDGGAHRRVGILASDHAADSAAAADE